MSKYRQKYKLDMVEWIPGKGANVNRNKSSVWTINPVPSIIEKRTYFRTLFRP